MVEDRRCACFPDRMKSLWATAGNKTMRSGRWEGRYKLLAVCVHNMRILRPRTTLLKHVETGNMVI